MLAIVVKVVFQRFPWANSLEEMWVWLFPLADQRSRVVVTRVSERDSSWITSPQDLDSLNTAAITSFHLYWKAWHQLMSDFLGRGWERQASHLQVTSPPAFCRSSSRFLYGTWLWPIVPFEASTLLTFSRKTTSKQIPSRGVMLKKNIILLYSLLNTHSILFVKFWLWHNGIVCDN